MGPELRLRAYADRVEGRLDALLPAADAVPARLHEAMRYSALAPGKRLRPALALAAADAVRPNGSDLALDAACAVEMVHAFSLIHDDLPAIDDDDLRRGRPTCHKRFDEATAVLAGDALFAVAFRVALAAPAGPEVAVLLADASVRLVQGEALDVFSEGRAVSDAELEFVHRNKTAALIGAAVEIGAAGAGASPETRQDLRRFGERIGLAFQIVDDVLNETATAEQLGKAVGSDRDRQKATYPARYGVERSREMARELVTGALPCLEGLPGDPEALRVFGEFAVQRMR